jgi:hypothetical protein
MADLIPDEYGIFDRHPVSTWIPVEDPAFIGAFAGKTIVRYLIAGVILCEILS